jgi:hypothetical protein
MLRPRSKLIPLQPFCFCLIMRQKPDEELLD